MTWTDKVPTRDGWYWWRPVRRLNPDWPAVVVEVKEWRDGDGDEEMMMRNHGEWRSLPHGDEWSDGPIPLPATRTAAAPPGRTAPG